ncbi:transposon-encoded TnpW family protein [Anaerotignum sp.]|uniref:transposon-encoded TnpW family protein n=1 Tax=Anaerotignum sp. TaxID=2039241 RepID=UPI0028B255BC|nr:transposon-encoded TnpW family protein [Anaerotignum sp.]
MVNNDTENVVKKEVDFSTDTRTFEQKIGTTTYIVSTRFNNNHKSDIVSKIARLIQNDTEDNRKL